MTSACLGYNVGEHLTFDLVSTACWKTKKGQIGRTEVPVRSERDQPSVKTHAVNLLNYPTERKHVQPTSYTPTQTLIPNRACPNASVTRRLLFLSILTFGSRGRPNTYKHTRGASTYSQARILPWPAAESQRHTQLCLDKASSVIQMPAEDIWFEWELARLKLNSVWCTALFNQSS